VRLLSPLIAPPNKNTNNVTKTIGCSVTSSSCSGLRLIRTSARHASVRACRSARAGVIHRARPDRQIDAVHCQRLPEPLDQARHLDRECHGMRSSGQGANSKVNLPG
jgi:hypothetical protein